MHLPLYHQYVGHDFAHKKANIDYKMWARPTIPWKLECEGSKPRESIFDDMLDAREHDLGATSNYWIYWISGFLLIFLPIAGGCLALIVHNENSL